MDQIKIALDWTPNSQPTTAWLPIERRCLTSLANHTGIFLAQDSGAYAKSNLKVDIVSPDSDNYETTPAAKLAKGEVDIALAPTESVLAYRLSSNPVPLKAVAAVLARDASAIATLSSSGIKRPRDLDGKRYASYGARFEDQIVREMIRADGGRGDIQIVKPPKLGIWETILNGEADATWIFEAWEGVEAKSQGIALTYFHMGDVGIPYGYSPVMLINETAPNAGAVKSFLHTTREAYSQATVKPPDGVESLLKHAPVASKSFVKDSQEFLSKDKYYGEAGTWGVMDENRWRAWISWLQDKKLLHSGNDASTTSIDDHILWTNDYLS